ncbi:MAG TPA: hypothetical protein VHG51_16050 [Longimicrobiaceae bacterium]|nr:hypothetical protein [Longimicrobiaceae bacterium]
MNAVHPELARRVFGAMVVGALAFGGTQALASPVQAAVYGCTQWEEQMCNDSCVYAYGPLAKGRCTNFGMYHCQCSLGPIDA